ncbi:MAG: hypothetical protein ACYTKD_24015 [Planctomycetota bacterium]|jgi:hypothetical protein
MRRIGGHAGVWLAAGLWAAAAPLNVALIAATVAPPELPDAAAPAAFHAERHPGESDGAAGTDESQPAEGAAPAEAIPEAGDPPTAPRARPGDVDTVIRTVIHEVAPGDSLMSVTRGYLGSGARWREVAEANEVPPPYVLETGASLRIPMARSARTEARVELLPPREDGPGPAPAAAPVKDVNPPPARTFEPLGKGLRISRPLAEAYPWEIPLHAALAFAGVALGAAVLAFAGAKRRMDPAGALRSLWWGTAAGGGACALLAGVATLGAAAIARSSVLQLLLAAAAGAGAGAAAWFAAKSTPGAEERGTPAYALTVRFGIAAGWLTASALAAASMAGWLPGALMALRLGA